ncbi:MAG TPA: transglycosylase domain-containing protein, partial [Mycobacteriales bacterium]|nr:transglycosylase domain-containing protein [Mycobacteriales bacterium]
MAAIALPTIGGLGLATSKSIDTFNDLPTALKNDGKPSQRSVMVASDGSTRIANLYLQNRQVIPLSEIPEVSRKAQIAVEDSRFYEHHGLDTRGVLRALLHDTQSGGASQGGSTLTQQYVKQVLLYSADTPEEQKKATEDTLGRKLREARLAIALEKKLSKNEILARYLNIAYFGAGAYGIETAAQTYFGIHASQLNLPQAALLAGLVQSPYGYDPYKHRDLALKRRHVVLTRMQQQGYITKAQMTEADKTPIEVLPKKAAPSNGCGEALLPDSGFFCDYVRSYLTDVLHLTKSQLYNGG